MRGLIVKPITLSFANTVKLTSSYGKRHLTSIDCLKPTFICFNASFIIGEKKQLVFWSKTNEQVNINRFIKTEFKIFIIIIILLLLVVVVVVVSLMLYLL